MGPLAGLQIPPEGGDAAKIAYHVGDRAYKVIDFFFRDIVAQRKPQGAVGNLVGPANGQQHMAGVQAAGGAGRAGGSADALVIQQQKQRLSFDAFKAEVHRAGQTAVPVAVELAVGYFFQSRDQLVPQGGQSCLLYTSPSPRDRG